MMLPETHDGLLIREEKFHAHSVPTWMVQDHFREVGGIMKQHVEVPEPNYDDYLKAQDEGKTLFVAVRESKALNLVGYVGLVIKAHPHYKNTIIATDDAYYLMPAYRGSGVGAAMLKYAEDAARERGAVVFLMRTKFAHNHGKIFEHLGYELEDLVYKKDLRHAAKPGD